MKLGEVRFALPRLIRLSDFLPTWEVCEKVEKNSSSYRIFHNKKKAEKYAKKIIKTGCAD